jgi:dephospho-CoA kinase
MLLVGLTGGIGSGKSTVSEALERRGAVVVDADRIVKELQQPGTEVFTEMVERFGDGIVGPDGQLDRPAVAAIVFSDAEALADLGAIVHPRVRDEMTRRLEELAATDEVVVLDVPLLVESGWEGMSGVVVVDLDPDVAVSRLVEFRGFDESDARNRIANQASREERLAKADVVVDNGGDLASLEAQVDRVWEWISGLEPAGEDFRPPG